MAAGRFEQRVQVRMAGRPLARDARELGLGDGNGTGTLQSSTLMGGLRAD
jgi:hypothetical protein